MHEIFDLREEDELLVRALFEHSVPFINLGLFALGSFLPPLVLVKAIHLDLGLVPLIVLLLDQSDLHWLSLPSHRLMQLRGVDSFLVSGGLTIDCSLLVAPFSPKFLLLKTERRLSGCHDAAAALLVAQSLIISRHSVLLEVIQVGKDWALRPVVLWML